jgi:hypothetical protein
VESVKYDKKLGKEPPSKEVKGEIPSSQRNPMRVPGEWDIQNPERAIGI